AVCGPAAGPWVPGVLALLRHRDGGVRQAARQCLGRLGETAIPYLAAIAAFWAAGDCPDAAEYADLFGDLAPHTQAAVPLLCCRLTAMANPRAAVRLGELGGLAAGAVPTLVGALNLGDAPMQSASAAALARVGVATPEVLAALRHRSGYGNEAARAAAAKAL